MLRLKCAPVLPVILAAALLLLPWGWVGAFLVAAAVHELGHILAVRIFGGKIVEMTLGLHGAQIRTTPMGPKFQLPPFWPGRFSAFFRCFCGKNAPGWPSAPRCSPPGICCPFIPWTEDELCGFCSEKTAHGPSGTCSCPPLFCWASYCIAWVSPSGGQVWPFQKNCLQTSGKTGTIGAIQK